MKKCFDYAIDYIYKYPKSEKEMKIHLMKKWYDDENIEKTMWMLKNLKYIDDENYTQMFLTSQCINHWKPFLAVRQKLLQKWISKDIISDVYEKLKAQAQESVFQKILKEIENYKSKWIEGFDIIQKLIRKGYDIKDIKKAIKIWH